MPMDVNTELLNQVYQNSQMGQLAARQLFQSIDDPDMREHLDTQLLRYDYINNQALQMLNAAGQAVGNLVLPEKPAAQAAMGLKPLAGNKAQNEAEAMLQNGAAGIADITQSISQCKDADIPVLNLAKQLLYTEEVNVEKLKKYLH